MLNPQHASGIVPRFPIALRVALFGSYRMKVNFDLAVRQQYALSAATPVEEIKRASEIFGATLRLGSRRDAITTTVTA